MCIISWLDAGPPALQACIVPHTKRLWTTLQLGLKNPPLHDCVRPQTASGKRQPFHCENM